MVLALLVLCWLDPDLEQLLTQERGLQHLGELAVIKGDDQSPTVAVP